MNQRQPHLQRPWAFWQVAAMVALSIIAYWPALRGSFIWDDRMLISDNHLIRADDGLYRIWFTSEPLDYWPLTNSSFWFEWRLWGTNTAGYHITNLLLHIAAGLLIWALLHQLGVPGSYLAALLFAVHPLNVESVAWIAQRKNTFALPLLLLSMLWYLRDVNLHRIYSSHGARLGIWYWLALIAFLLAMLCKGSVAIMPLLLLVILWWQQQRVTLHDWLRIGPFFLIAAALTIVNIRFQTYGTGEVIRSAGFPERLAGAGAAVWFYLAKALMPINLSFVYPQWHIHLTDVLWWLPTIAGALVTAILLRGSNSSTTTWPRHLMLAWTVFCFSLLPVLGFTDIYFMKYSLVADHYAHIALIAVMALVGAVWYAWRNSGGDGTRWSAGFTSVILVGVLTLLTMQQSSLYADAISLYQATLVRNPASTMIHNNLGTEFLDAGQPHQAISHFEQVLRLDPENAEAHNNLGLALAKLGSLPAAVEHCRYALQLKPDFPEAHSNLGSLLSELGQLDEAIKELNAALHLRPALAEAHYNLAAVLMKLGQTPEAIQHYRLALQSSPDYVEALNNLANALCAVGSPQEALPHLENAARLQPDSPVIQFNLATTCLRINRRPEGIAAAKRALALARASRQDALVQQIESWLQSNSGASDRDHLP